MMPYPPLPAHLQPFFEFRGFETVRIDGLRVGLVVGARIRYLPVTDTPHYAFARQELAADPVRLVYGYADYSHYARVTGQPRGEESFVTLIKSIVEHGYRWRTDPILVMRSWRRLWPVNGWDVADGFHRLAVLAALNVWHIRVGTLRRSRIRAFQGIVDSLSSGGHGREC